MNEQLKTLPQYLVPHHLLSRLIGWFAHCRQATFKNALIDEFIRYYGVDMQTAIEPNPHEYATFNDFFTRKLKPDARPIVTGVDEIACPVDGMVSQVGTVAEDKIFQAKGFHFDLEELMGGSKQHIEPFINGQFATLYLAPKDYHRIHMPLAGKLREMVYIPGHLFSVNFNTTRTVPRLFARNERVVAIFDTAIGPMALILVGAMIVASINTVWHGEVTPPARKQIQTWDYADANIQLDKGAEMGFFKLGSTVIVLFGANKMTFADTIKPEQPVQLGQLLGITSP